MGRDADRYVDRMLRGRRPEPFTPDDDEAAEIRTAIELAAAAPDAGRPAEDFVAGLRERLAARIGDGAAGEAEPATPGPHAPSGPHPVRGGRPPLSAGRRRFLRAGAVAASAFAAGFATDRALAPDSGRDAQAGPSATDGGEITAAHGTWQTVADSTDLPEGAVRDFDLGAVAGFVHRTGGRLRAVSGTCTHQACRLALDDARSTLVCPCHGATFGLAGDPLHNFRSQHPLPALPRLPVRESGGRVQVYGPPHTADA